MPDFNPHVKEPTEREYELTCRIVRKKMQYDDDQSRGSLGNTEVDVVLLVPEQSSECDRFFGAWLPEPAVITLEGKVFQDNFYEVVPCILPFAWPFTGHRSFIPSLTSL